MKKLILLITMLTLSWQIFAQDVVKDKTYYQAKSKRQKGAGYGLLIGGGVAVGIGLLVGNSNEASFDDAMGGAVIGAVGALAMLGSIPMFLASGKNKRKAELMVKTISLPANPLALRTNRQVHLGIRLSL